MEFNDDNAYFDETRPPLYEHFCLSAGVHINSGDLESLTFTSKTVLDSILSDSIFIPNVLICFTTGDAWYSQGAVKFKYDGSGSLGNAIAWNGENVEILNTDISMGQYSIEDFVLVTSFTKPLQSSTREDISESISGHNFYIYPKGHPQFASKVTPTVTYSDVPQGVISVRQYNLAVEIPAT